MHEAIVHSHFEADLWSGYKAAWDAHHAFLDAAHCEDPQRYCRAGLRAADLRMVKSPAETELIREACRWGDHAHRLMQGTITPGANELLVSHTASLQAIRGMLRALGDVVGGYESELERTMHVSGPTADFERYVAAMLSAQDAGLAALRPGRTCVQVEADVRACIEAPSV